MALDLDLLTMLHQLCVSDAERKCSLFGQSNRSRPVYLTSFGASRVTCLKITMVLELNNDHCHTWVLGLSESFQFPSSDHVSATVPGRSFKSRGVLGLICVQGVPFSLTERSCSRKMNVLNGD